MNRYMAFCLVLLLVVIAMVPALPAVNGKTAAVLSPLKRSQITADDLKKFPDISIYFFESETWKPAEVGDRIWRDANGLPTCGKGCRNPIRFTMPCKEKVVTVTRTVEVEVEKIKKEIIEVPVEKIVTKIVEVEKKIYTALQVTPQMMWGVVGAPQAYSTTYFQQGPLNLSLVDVDDKTIANGGDGAAAADAAAAASAAAAAAAATDKTAVAAHQGAGTGATSGSGAPNGYRR